MERKKNVDESWKDAAVTDTSAKEAPSAPEAAVFEVNFVNYVMGMAFQAMIFLGEVPNPMTNTTEKNPEQAKFIIDSLLMIREKTKGNLTSDEENLLNGSLYELQMKFVEGTKPPIAP